MAGGLEFIRIVGWNADKSVTKCLKRRFCHRIWRFLEKTGLAGLANVGIDVPLSRFCGGGTEKDGRGAEKGEELCGER